MTDSICAMACLLQQVIGKNVRTLRTRRNLSQETLAGMLEMDRCHLQDVESGHAEVGSNLLLGLCAALNVSLNLLLRGRPVAVDEWKRMTVKFTRH